MPWYNPFSWFRRKPEPRFEITRIPPTLDREHSYDYSNPTYEQLVLRERVELQRQRLERANKAPIRKTTTTTKTDDDIVPYVPLDNSRVEIHSPVYRPDSPATKSGRGGDFAGAGATGSWDDDDNRKQAAAMMAAATFIPSDPPAPAPAPAPAPCRASSYSSSDVGSSDSSSSSSSGDSGGGGGGGGGD